jgi:hypothetical protein
MAQSAGSGSLAGKLTDLYSVPLDGATVVLHNQATGKEAHTVTQRNGAYRFAGLDAGEYTLQADSPKLGRGHVEGIVVAAGHESRVQTAMEFQPSPPKPIPVIFHEIELPSLKISAIVETEPMLVLPLRGRVRLDAAREISETIAPTVNVRVGAETMQATALNGKSARDLSREKPETAALAINALVAAEPMQTLAMGGRNRAGHQPGITVQTDSDAARAGQARASGSDSAVDMGASRTVQAANSVVQSVPEPTRTASQATDPLSPVVTTTVAGDQLQSLPSSGRRWQDFVLETPTATASTGEESQTSLRGAGQEPAAITVDGASRASAFGTTGGGWARGRGAAISEVAIREVETVAGNVETAASHSAGGRMAVATMRGANALHGQGFLFDRQNTWGAQNPFTQWVKETALATSTTIPVFTPEAYTPPDREMTWGVGLGSHIRRDKLFWFAALDSYQRNDPGLATVKHPDMFFAQPTNDQMQVLSARLGPSNNPVVAGLAAYSQMLETLEGLLGPAPRTATQWTGFGRIDWEAAERHRLTLEGTGAQWDSPGGGLTRVEETFGNHSFGSSEASEEWLLGRWEAFLTPNLLAVTQFSAGHTIQGARPETPSAYEQTLNQNVWGQLPQIVVDSRYGFTIGNPSRYGAGSYPDEHLYQAEETVDWIRGPVLIKAGFDVSHNADSISLLRNQTGTYYYSNVENFASDALVFENFGFSGELDPIHQRNCDQTGKVWRDSNGVLNGRGALPCYSYYSQTMGPTNWWLSTNDWAGYTSTQWQASKLLVLSAGLRWEREQLPPPISALINTDLPQTEKLPSLGNNWGPRLGLALGTGESNWPVLRLGYGMYFGRLENATLETALTQTGSPNGDLNFFIRPTDGFNSANGTGNAPPFPHVLAGEPLSIVKPGAVEFAPAFRNSEIHQAVTAVEESLPGHVRLTSSALVSLGRRLPVSMDINIDPAVNPQTITYGVVDGTGLGPIKTTQITVPFYASWPSTTSNTGFAGRIYQNYQQISEIMSRANSTYEAAMVKLTRDSRHGLSLRTHYTYAHAMDWNPNESAQVAGGGVLDPAHFSEEYGTSNLDVRHSAAATVVYEAPWKLQNVAGRMANGWMLSAIGQFRSGLPYTMRTSGSLPKEFDASTGAAIVGLGPGMNGSGGDNRVYGVGRNTYRYPSTWKADLRLGKRFDLGHMRQLELLAESFNLFNHQNVTELETTGYYIESGSLTGGFPTLNFLTGLKVNTTAFGQPLNVNATNFYRERQLQVGLRMRF